MESTKFPGIPADVLQRFGAFAEHTGEVFYKNHIALFWDGMTLTEIAGHTQALSFESWVHLIDFAFLSDMDKVRTLHQLIEETLFRVRAIFQLEPHPLEDTSGDFTSEVYFDLAVDSAIGDTLDSLSESEVRHLTFRHWDELMAADTPASDSLMYNPFHNQWRSSFFDLLLNHARLEGLEELRDYLSVAPTARPLPFVYSINQVNHP